MKKLSLLLTGLLVLIFTACKDDTKNDVEMPGEIPGMGDASGELQVSDSFVLPEGVTLLSITGVNEPNPADDFSSAALKSVTSEDPEQDLYYLPAVGSGGGWIALELLFEIADDTNKDIIIPAGMMVECQADGYQHGIILQDVRIHITGPSENNEHANDKAFHLQVKLYMYCINKGKAGSTKVVTYVFKGVTSSELMDELIAALEYKKLDISKFSEEELAEYEEITAGIQDIVWAITNGRGVNDKDWTFINGLREIITSYE